MPSDPLQVKEIFSANACNPMDCMQAGGFMDKLEWLNMYEEGTGGAHRLFNHCVHATGYTSNYNTIDTIFVSTQTTSIHAAMTLSTRGPAQ